MSDNDLFDRVKAQCDDRRLIANATGKIQVAAFTIDDTNYILSIGCWAVLGAEFVFVGDYNKDAMKLVIPGLLGRICRMGHVPEELEIDVNRWGFCKASYNKLNIPLKGLMAAVYGREIQIYQMAVPDINNRHPWESGYIDGPYKQPLYLE